MKYVAGILATFFAAVMIHGQVSTDNDLPAFHAAPPAKIASLPPLLTEQQLAQQGLTLPAQKESYKAGQDFSSSVPDALLLPLRPACRTHQPAELLRINARRELQHLHGGSFVRLPAVKKEGSVSEDDPRRDYPRRLQDH